MKTLFAGKDMSNLEELLHIPYKVLQLFYISIALEAF